MLYVFHVDAGLMTTYDMNLTLQSVSCLKSAIERKTKISANSLVLLVSGGEVLQSDHMVSSYSAGTDTNPIYMFSKPSIKEGYLKQSSIYSDLSPIPELEPEFRSDGRLMFEGKSVAELTASVEACVNKPPTVQTVIACTGLAQEFSDCSHDVLRSCDQLVHEQHLQHQGWAAVVANLEDIFNEFCERSRNFKESFKKHRLKRDSYHQMLNTLNEVLESLGKIPILPALQLNAEAHRFSAFDVFEETDFEGQPYKVTHPLESSSEKTCQDFGVEALKFSGEDVFVQKDESSSNPAQSSESDQQIEESDDGVTFRAHSYESSKEEPTLLHWILAQGNKASLQDILDYCQKGLALEVPEDEASCGKCSMCLKRRKIDVEPLKEQEGHLCHILQYANDHGLKQIRGIEDRLFGLDQILNEVKKLERDQRDQAASLIQHRDRLNVACDPSVLPTLVQSHCCQLQKLLAGYTTMVDRRRRIARSKEELSQVLKARLEAVLKIENSMSVQDAHSMLSFQCFNRLERYFGIVAQLHRAPVVFVRAVHEVARRRTFSQAHTKWATDLAAKLLKIHDEEVSRRQEFNSVFEGHFLKSLFPGMTELPPTFATQAPPEFDARLPAITDEEVRFISSAFEELASDVPTYDMDSIVKFFRQRFNASEHEDKEVYVQADLDKDAESEAETGDFEKLSGQSSKQKIDTSTTCVPETMAVSTVTEDNMDSHKLNMERLQEFLVKLCVLCRANIIFIKEELTKLKSDIDEQKNYIKNEYIQIVDAYEKSNQEIAIRHREQMQRLTVDHELELSDMKATLAQKDDAIDILKKEKEDLKAENQKEIDKLNNEHQSTKDLLEKTREELAAFEKKFEDLEAQKQKDIKELQEKMHLDYKAEIESLRARFRLVALTNMDRSPSESSLEKIERTDVIEISNHNTIVMQTKENAEVEREEAVRDAVLKVEADWRAKFEAERTKFESEKQVTINDVTRRLLAEKDRQLDLLRERELTLSRECGKYRDTIQQLTDPDTNDYDALLKAQFATLEDEKATLHQQVLDLKKELEKKAEEGDKSDSDGRSSPRRMEARRRARCHTPLGLAAGTLSLSSCLPGHAVLVLWDPQHLNYTVMQEATIMYFVHSDCLPALDLSIQVKNESERRLYAIATVESKEYCYAKKSGNRYGMPRGSRFYRVRVRPLRGHAAAPPACCDHRHKQDVMKSSVLSALGEKRPVKKWLTYMHAPDMQKSVDTSQSTSSTTEETSRVGEVATATLINLDSPVSTSECAPAAPGEDQLDSIEASEHWHSRMQLSTSSAMTDMECSVGRVPGGEPLELTVSAVAVVARGAAPPGSELAEEAAP